MLVIMVVPAEEHLAERPGVLDAAELVGEIGSVCEGLDSHAGHAT
jgi:hypothetical protein